MKRFTGILLVFICIGCAITRPITPEKSWQIAADTYLSTMRLMVEYRADGLIDDDDYAAIEKVRITTRMALNLLGAAASLNNATLSNQARIDFASAIDDLIKTLEAARKEKINGPGNR